MRQKKSACHLFNQQLKKTIDFKALENCVLLALFIHKHLYNLPNMKLKFFSIALAAITMFSACNRSDQATEITISDTFALEGPLYEGSNPAQLIYPVDIKNLLGDKYHEGVTITDATLASATISALDSNSLSGITSMVLSVASDNPELKMLELGVINPIAEGSTNAALNPSAEANAGKYFQEKQYYIILDVALAEDLDDNLALKADIKFNLKHN